MFPKKKKGEITSKTGCMLVKQVSVSHQEEGTLFFYIHIIFKSKIGYN